MSAIISDKFRIYNAEQFMTALGDDKFETDGTPNFGAAVERSRMYFFIGRPQDWFATLEIYNKTDDGAAVAWADVPSGYWVEATPASGGAVFRGEIAAVYENVVLLRGGIEGSNTFSSTPALGGDVTVYDGDPSGTGVLVANLEATAGVYRYSTEDIVPTAFDNDKELFEVYDDMIAAKRMTIDFTKSVVKAYRWPVAGGDTYDMYINDYSVSFIDNKITGKTSANGSTTLTDSKFYVMNNNFEVFKCLYNGAEGATYDGVVGGATIEPSIDTTFGGVYRATDGVFYEDKGGIAAPVGSIPCFPSKGYVWKYMFTVPTQDVLKFLSTDFMPIPLNDGTSGSNRADVEAIANDGGIMAAKIRRSATELADGTYYAPVVGDGSVGKDGDGGALNSTALLRFEVAANVITELFVIGQGDGYTYGKVYMESGVSQDGNANNYGLFTSVDGGVNLTPAVIPAPTAAGGGHGEIEVIIGPRGGHGAAGAGKIERELGAKRVMSNIVLRFDEGEGDFPTDNDFRRIGILKDPNSVPLAGLATERTLYAVKRLKFATVAGGGFVPDDYIYQNRVQGGVPTGLYAKGRVIGVDDANGIITYYQSVDEHADNGVVREFQDSSVAGFQVVTANDLNPVDVPGSNPSATGTLEGVGTVTVGAVDYVNGYAPPEIEANSGDLLYVENRRLITRALDQEEDIKLVIEF